MERRAIVPVNETKQVQHFEPRTWFSICIVGLSTELFQSFPYGLGDVHFSV